MSQELLNGAALMGADADFGVPVINTTGVATEQVADALGDGMKSIQKALKSWASGVQGNQRGGTGLFQRDQYVTPDKVFDQMKLAYQAVADDDIVSGVAESTEATAFSKVSLFADDEDDKDIYNQIAADMDLDSRLREIWRELFIVSQVYVGVWWQKKTYTVRGQSKEGKKRKKTYNVKVPTDLTILDPLKIVPVGNFMFGKERLAYIADRGEAELFAKIGEGDAADGILERIIEKEYEPTKADQARFKQYGVGTGTRYFLLKQDSVFRHTLTRPDYEAFSPVRMNAVFPLLDMKNQLRQMDRAHLIGGTNFIVLITVGTDARPAIQQEVDAMRAQVQVVARTPILVGDHRLNVEIITPKTDNTLKPERYNAIDSRITGRLYQMFVLGNYAAGSSGDDSVKLMKVIAAGIESRRHQLARSLAKHVFTPMFDDNKPFKTRPKLRYSPKNIALEFDQGYAQFLFDMRQSGMISRESFLTQFDFDQEDEARLLQREDEQFDDIFNETVLFNPQPDDKDDSDSGDEDDEGMTETEKRQAGRRGGGNRNGGGAAPGSGQGQDPRKPGREQRKAA